VQTSSLSQAAEEAASHDLFVVSSIWHMRKNIPSLFFEHADAFGVA
jgi:hypothetical protein